MADCCSAPGLMPVNQALTHLLSSVNTVPDVESIPLELADGRILAQPVTSILNVPAFNNSAMDGYAIRADELSTDLQTSQTEFELVGKALAGQPFDGELQNGQCIRIMTGAVAPDSANAVAMQENTKAEGVRITLCQNHKLNENIRFAGEDMKQGQAVFDAGHKITSVDIGLLASLGVPEVLVYRKLRVALFSTGDELKLPGEPLATGDIYDSNRHSIKAMLKRMNVEVIDMGIIRDDKNAIINAFLTADTEADAVISSGGVSVGEADYTKEVLDELGDIEFWKVAMKPGKPFAFGNLPNSVFFGLPGNPVSATVTFHVLAVPTLVKMMGTSYQTPLSLPAKTLAKIKKRPGRMDFQRGIAQIDEQGQLTVMPLSAQGSGILSSMSRANCYIVLAQDDGGKNPDNMVSIQMFDAIVK